MKEENLEEIQRLEISSDLVKAYLINMTKSLIFIAALVGVFYFVIYILGENPFVDAFNTLGIPLVWGKWAFIAFAALFLVSALLNTLSLTSYGLVFEADNLKYSYGGFFKATKSTPIANIIRVNFKEYKPLQLGDIVVDFTGTEEKTLRVQYVSNAKHQCELINKLMNLKKSEQVEEISEKGVL